LRVLGGLTAGTHGAVLNGRLDGPPADVVIVFQITLTLWLQWRTVANVTSAWKVNCRETRSTSGFATRCGVRLTATTTTRGGFPAAARRADHAHWHCARLFC
jgi:hypothetical protein